MNNPKTTIFGTVAAVAGTLATSLTGTAGLIAQIIAGLAGTLFAYHSADATKK
jgi:uncharacterized membrane protein YeaQ/YmgE (transglycosylase-associated protein family)